MKNKFLSLLMAMIMVIGMGGNLVSYADDSLKIYPSSIYESEGKEFATLTVTVQNHTDQPMSGVVVSISNDDKIPNPGTLNNSKTVSVPAKKDGKPGEAAVTWEVNLIGIPMGTVHFLTAKAVSNGNNASERFSITVNPKSDGDIGKANLPDMTPKDYTYKPDPTVNYNPQVKLQVIAPSGGINGGATNSVQLKIQNTGNAPFNQVTAGITTLGDKMTLQNSPTEQQLGAMARNGEKTVSFPIHVEGSHPGGNVPIGFTVKVLDPTGKETSFSITEYVTVNSGTSLADRLEIVNISNPSTVVPNQDFTLTFAVRNNSSSVAKNVKITVEPTAPVVNKTKNIFVENLAGGSSKAFNIKMFAPINAETQAQNYPIKITAETTGPDAASIVQYSGVFVNSGNEKTVPQLIITHYTYGGEAAVANEVFPLSMVIKNTNTNQTIKNIKVSLLAEEGVFIPHNASSSFYIASIGPGGSATKTVEMMTKPDAPEKTVAINVDMTYEDKNGSQVTAKDIISVPVVQMRRIVVDDVVATEPLFVGQQANISVQYYNMGKSTLSNLIISAEGDFTFPQSTKVFVGKFDPGKNDFYDLQLIPNNVGEASGKLIFSFEDSNGKQITMEKPFKLTAEEAMPVEPPMEEIPENGNGKKPWIYGIGGGFAAAVIGTLIYKKRKKKMNDSLDMDNDNE